MKHLLVALSTTAALSLAVPTNAQTTAGGAQWSGGSSWNGGYAYSSNGYGDGYWGGYGTGAAQASNYPSRLPALGSMPTTMSQRIEPVELTPTAATPM